MLKNLIIIGAGGVGRESALIVEDINEVKEEWNILGFVDDNKAIHNQEINNYKVLGGLDYILNYKEEVYVVCAIANYEVKKKIINKLQDSNLNIRFANLIHPSIKINSTVTIGTGCIIYQGNIITANIEIGNHVILSPKCGIGHDTVIKDYCTLLWNVNVSGNVLLEEGVTMGSGSTIIQGKKIEKGSFIGAGAVVIRDIRESSTVVGVPTRYISEVEGNEENIVCNNC
ncbi:MAG: acetyltransferase [Paraclostridium sp.]